MKSTVRDMLRRLVAAFAYNAFTSGAAGQSAGYKYSEMSPVPDAAAILAPASAECTFKICMTSPKSGCRVVRPGVIRHKPTNEQRLTPASRGASMELMKRAGRGCEPLQ